MQWTAARQLLFFAYLDPLPTTLLLKYVSTNGELLGPSRHSELPPTLPTGAYQKTEYFQKQCQYCPCLSDSPASTAYPASLSLLLHSSCEYLSTPSISATTFALSGTSPLLLVGTAKTPLSIRL